MYEWKRGQTEPGPDELETVRPIQTSKSGHRAEAAALAEHEAVTEDPILRSAAL